MGWVDLHCRPPPPWHQQRRPFGFEIVVATPRVRSGVWDERLESRAAAGQYRLGVGAHVVAPLFARTPREVDRTADVVRAGRT